MNNFQNQYSNTQPNNQNNQQTSQQAHQQQTGFQGQSNAQTQQPPSIMMKLMNSCLPVLLEQFTGQAMSPMGGNNAEMQLALSQVISLQQQILMGQQNLEQRLVQLETNASQQFLGLAQEIKSIKSVRLTHDRERKQIEFNGDSNFQQQQED
jgi:hypothetical protein